MRKTAIAFALAVAPSLLAQQPTVGAIPPNPAFAGFTVTTAPVTWIDLANHATAAGTINKVTLHWGASCINAFKIVFLRGNLSSVSTFTVVETRGPFSAVQGRNDITLSPPVAVQPFDYIGVVQLQPFSACNSVMYQMTKGSGYRVITNKDMSTGGSVTVGTSNNYISGSQMALFGYNSDPVLVRVLPAAGAVAGIGTFFRTSVQLYNASGATMTGKLVFHKAGQVGSDSDPSLAFTLTPRQTRTYPDVITAMGSSGLGSLDVFTDGGAVPVVTARVFSDNAGATSGFTEEALAPSEALQSVGNYGVLPLPADLTNFRMNVGVRTLSDGVVLSITVYDAAGNQIRSRSLPFGPNWFEQQTASAFTDAAFLPAGGSIVVFPTAGSAFVYGTITDNRTTDSSMRIAAMN